LTTVKIETMLRSLIVLAGICLSAGALAQTVSHATFYSPDGLRFIIYLNGQQMNSEPQTEVRCINLTQPYYSAKAVFEDPALAPAERKMLQLTDAHHNRVDATFVVEKNRKGEMKIGWKSQSLYPQFIYEEKTPTVVVVGGGAGVQQTTTTTRTVTPAQQEGVSMSFGGLGGQVSVNTGGSGQAVVEEMTTTTTAAPVAAGTAQLPCTGTILGTSDFDEALGTVRMRSTEDGRLQSGKMLVTTNCITTDQLKKIGFLLETEQARLDLAIYAYPYTLDKGSYFKMNALFTQEASIDALNNAILGK
jgi:hypothetical protein